MTERNGNVTGRPNPTRLLFRLLPIQEDRRTSPPVPISALTHIGDGPLPGTSIPLSVPPTTESSQLLNEFHSQERSEV